MAGHGAGKGDRRRPYDPKKWAENYERIFGKKHTDWDSPEHLKWVQEAQQEKEQLSKELDKT